MKQANYMQLVRDAAARQRQRTPEEVAAVRETWRKERLAAHREEQRRATVPHLVALGVGEREAELVARGEVEEWEAVALVREWMGRTGEESVLLALVGAPGAGKSVAGAVACARGSVTSWHDGELKEDMQAWAPGLAKRVGAGEMLAQVFGDDAERRLEALQRVPLLVVDELGLEHWPASGEPAWRGPFDRLITRRCEMMRKTLLLGNLLPWQVEGGKDGSARYGGRVARRVRDHGALHVVRPQQAARAAGGGR